MNADAQTNDVVSLVERVEAGDPAAEEELVSICGPGLRVILRRLARDPSLADDLFQETLTVVLTKVRAGDLREPRALAAFVRSTARNLFLADRRKEARYQTQDEESFDRLRRCEPQPAQLRSVLAREETDLVRRLLGELRFARDRELLIRVYLRDDPKDEICADLGVDPEYYNRVLYRARQRLRELWERSEKRRRVLLSSLFWLFLRPVRSTRHLHLWGAEKPWT